MIIDVDVLHKDARFELSGTREIPAAARFERLLDAMGYSYRTTYTEEGYNSSLKVRRIEASPACPLCMEYLDEHGFLPERCPACGSDRSRTIIPKSKAKTA